MSRVASALTVRRKSPRLLASRPDETIVEDTIIEDLRSFARDLGVLGCSAMSKPELVETLRQRYLLELIRADAAH